MITCNIGRLPGHSTIQENCYAEVHFLLILIEFFIILPEKFAPMLMPRTLAAYSSVTVMPQGAGGLPGHWFMTGLRWVQRPDKRIINSIDVFQDLAILD